MPPHHSTTVEGAAATAPGGGCAPATADPHPPAPSVGHIAPDTMATSFPDVAEPLLPALGAMVADLDETISDKTPQQVQTLAEPEIDANKGRMMSLAFADGKLSEGFSIPELRQLATTEVGIPDTAVARFDECWPAEVPHVDQAALVAVRTALMPEGVPEGETEAWGAAASGCFGTSSVVDEAVVSPLCDQLAAVTRVVAEGAACNPHDAIGAKLQDFKCKVAKIKAYEEEDADANALLLETDKRALPELATVMGTTIANEVAKMQAAIDAAKDRTKWLEAAQTHTAAELDRKVGEAEARVKTLQEDITKAEKGELLASAVSAEAHRTAAKAQTGCEQTEALNTEHKRVIGKGREGLGLMAMVEMLVRLQRTGAEARTARAVTARVAAVTAESLTAITGGAPFNEFREDQRQCLHTATRNLGALRWFRKAVNAAYHALVRGMAEHTTAMEALLASVVHSRWEIAEFVLPLINAYEVIEAKQYLLECEEQMGQVEHNSRRLARTRMPAARKADKIDELAAKRVEVKGELDEATEALTAAEATLDAFCDLMRYEETCDTLGKPSVRPMLKEKLDATPRLPTYPELLGGWMEQQALTAAAQ